MKNWIWVFGDNGNCYVIIVVFEIVGVISCDREMMYFVLDVFCCLWSGFVNINSMDLYGLIGYCICVVCS